MQSREQSAIGSGWDGFCDGTTPTDNREPYLEATGNQFSVIFESLETLLYLSRMEYKEARERFIQEWGTLGSSWGINRAMAQIHALLLISTEPLSTDDIMRELKMSRGNVNMNIRSLIDWGIVRRENKVGERKEYFSTSKDVWELARQVARERRKRELEPVLQMLTQVRKTTGDDHKAVSEFRKVTGDLYDFASKVDSLLDTFTQSDKNWFYKLLMKL